MLARRSPLGLAEGRALTRFVGRERHLAALRDLFEEARAGRGQAVGVMGEPGIGKTRLLWEFRRSLGGARVTVLEGRCLSYGAGIPYLPLLKDAMTDTVGPNTGAAIQWRKWGALPAATSALTEGTPPTEGSLTVTAVTATLAQYGAFQKVSPSTLAGEPPRLSHTGDTSRKLPDQA